MAVQCTVEARTANLKKIAADREWGPKDFVDALGRSASFWSDRLSGDSPRPIGEKLARSIEEGLGLPIYTLDSPLDRRAVVTLATSTPPAEQDVTIPQFETGGRMGNGLVLRDQPGVIHSWHVTPEWVSKNVRNATSAKNLCIVTGFGDSMKGLYNPGDPLLVDRGVTTVEFDAIYFFRVDNEGFIKRLQRVPGEGILVLSENKAYRDWTIKPDMDFEVFGRVLKIWKGEEF